MPNITFLIDETPHWRSRIDALQGDFPDLRIDIPEGEEDLVHSLARADAVVAGRFPTERLEQSPKLRAIFVPFAGVNPFPLAQIKERGIGMFNSHGAAPFVAERILALTLALLGRVAEADRKLRRGEWLRAEPGMFWHSMRGRNVVFLGAGHLAQEAAALMKPLAQSLTAWGRRPRTSPPDNFDDYTTDKLDALDRADLLVLTAPLTPQTEGIIAAADLQQLKNAFVVNVGRAQLIDEAALYDALRDGTLAGFATDVHYVYKRGEDGPVMPSQLDFHELDNVVMTAHSAAHVTAARQANIDGAFANIRSWLVGGTDLQRVDLDAGY